LIRTKEKSLKAKRSKSRVPKVNHKGIEKKLFGSSLLPYISYIYLGILSILFIMMCYQNKHMQDDAFITFRYADNFVHGHGLVFNIGEKVEGFTSVLWILILSVAKIIGIDLISFSQLAGIAFGVFSIWITFSLSQMFFYGNYFDFDKSVRKNETYPEILLNLIPSTMLAFTGAYQYWAISGMEVTLFVFMMLISIYSYVDAVGNDKPLIKFSIYITTASLVRPEGVLLFIVLILHYWLHLYKKQNSVTLKKYFNDIISKRNRIPLLIFISANMVLLIFRFFYFGYPLPNTFYAKTGLSSEYLIAGWNYISDFFNTYLIYGTLFLIGSLFIYKKEKLNFGLLISLIIVFIIYSILIGGDVLPLFRFVLPVLPLIYIVFTKSIIALSKTLFIKLKSNSKNLYASAAIIISLAIVFKNYVTPKESIGKYALRENQLVEKMSASGKWLAEKQAMLGRRFVIAASTIGAVSYFSDATIIDMLGLTDKTIAHNPKPILIISGSHTGWKERNYNIDYLLSQKPDYIYFSTGLKPSAYAERALFLSEDFVNNYYPYFFNAIDNLVETIYKRKTPAIEKNNLIHFSANPNFDSNYVNLYNELLNIKNNPDLIDRAFSICGQISKIGPSNFTGADYQLALLYEKKKDKNNVLRVMKDAAAKDDYVSLAHFYLARQYSIEKNLPMAKSEFELVQKYNPDFLEYQTKRRQNLEN
jgi:arabinofuranosyltransferase